jgi:FAD synthetase
MKTVMCFGTFDKLHPGHIFYLKQSRKLGDYLIVVMARDDNVEKLKHKRPYDNENKRLVNVEKIGFVDNVVLGNKKDKLAIVKKFNPDIISLGYDQGVDMEKLKKIYKGKIVYQKSFKPLIYKSSKIK